MVFRLKKYNYRGLPNFIYEELKDKIAFNPSFLQVDENHFLAIRIYDAKKNKIVSYFYHYKGGELLYKTNLSEYFSKNENIDYVADPKLLLLDNELFVTFNNGYKSHENNKICIFRYTHNEIVDFFYCEYSNRNRVEKNWAFFKDNGRLKILYSISPLTILEEGSKEGNTIYFKEIVIDKNQFYNDYTIGTQMFKVGEIYYFIGHFKIFIKKKRIYFGYPFIFNSEDNKISRTDKILIHSVKSLFGSKFKFNKNLISCTYFSGIYLDEENTFLSYGINDVSWCIAKIKNKKLWS